MIKFLAMTAVVNIAVGFGLAVYLGRKCNVLGDGIASDNGPDAPLRAAPMRQGTDIESILPDESSAAEMHGALEQLKQEVVGHHERLLETDQSLRSRVGAADPAEFENLMKSLLDATDQYVRQREEAHEVVASLTETRHEFQPSCTKIATALRGEDQEIHAMRRLADGFNAEGDLAAQNSAWIGVVGGLLDAGSRVRDEIDNAIAGRCEADGASADAASADRSAQADRAKAEIRLAQWWSGDPERTRTMSAALFDFDQFRVVNQQFGRSTADASLRAVGHWLASQPFGTDVAQPIGQRFLLVFPDADLRSAMEMVERVRQSIEHMSFVTDGEEFQLTVCCGLAEANAGDNHDSLLRRAEASLDDAKRYGRNRTFLHEDGFTVPLVPQEIAVEKRQVRL